MTKMRKLPLGKTVLSVATEEREEGEEKTEKTYHARVMSTEGRREAAAVAMVADRKRHMIKMDMRYTIAVTRIDMTEARAEGGTIAVALMIAAAMIDLTETGTRVAQVGTMKITELLPILMRGMSAGQEGGDMMSVPTAEIVAMTTVLAKGAGSQEEEILIEGARRGAVVIVM